MKRLGLGAEWKKNCKKSHPSTTIGVEWRHCRSNRKWRSWRVPRDVSRDPGRLIYWIGVCGGERREAWCWMAKESKTLMDTSSLEFLTLLWQDNQDAWLFCLLVCRPPPPNIARPLPRLPSLPWSNRFTTRIGSRNRILCSIFMTVCCTFLRLWPKLNKQTC